jgi:hypothetical protein
MMQKSPLAIIKKRLLFCKKDEFKGKPCSREMETNRVALPGQKDI